MDVPDATTFTVGALSVDMRCDAPPAGNVMSRRPPCVVQLLACPDFTPARHGGVIRSIFPRSDGWLVRSRLDGSDVLAQTVTSDKHAQCHSIGVRMQLPELLTDLAV